MGGTPDAGDEFSVVENEARAREITEFRQRNRDAKVQAGARGTLDEMFSQIQAGRSKRLRSLLRLMFKALRGNCSERTKSY